MLPLSMPEMSRPMTRPPELAKYTRSSYIATEFSTLTAGYDGPIAASSSSVHVGSL